jgi:hypothetical protein
MRQVLRLVGIFYLKGAELDLDKTKFERRKVKRWYDFDKGIIQ